MKQDYPQTRVLVTGGCGFVMSNVIRNLLATNLDATVVSLDINATDRLTQKFFEPFSDRITHIQGDVRQPSSFNLIPNDQPITHVVHAAMIAHQPQWEREHPDKVLEVNIMGTVNALEWTRTQPNIMRFLYVSSGDVYGEPNAETSQKPHLETGTLDQPELYAISKYASEQIVRRYGDIFNLDTATVRFSGVFGPMERPTPGRSIMAMPYHMVRAVIENRPLRVTAGTLQAGADFISSEDIGSILPRLLISPTLSHDIYNVAYGQFTAVPDVFQSFKSIVPEFDHEVVIPELADVIRDPSRRLARWNAYDIGRLSSEFDWQPRPIAEQLASYFQWVMQDPELHCPRLPQENLLNV